MKQFKLLSMLLAILMVPMMVSCGGDDEKDDKPSGDDLIIKFWYMDVYSKCGCHERTIITRSYGRQRDYH